MLRVLAILGATVVGTIVTATLQGMQPTLEQEICRKEKCAVCNLELDETKTGFACRRHAAHEKCKRTLQDQGQLTCPICRGRL